MLELNDIEIRRRRVQRCSLLSAVSLLCLVAVQPAGAQEAVPEDGYAADGVTDFEPAAPLANTVTDAETVLPAKYPDYFEKAYKLYMKAPLLAKIFEQGRIPAVIPQLEINRNALGTNGTYLPSGPVVTANHAFFKALGHQRPFLRHATSGRSG